MTGVASTRISIKSTMWSSSFAFLFPSPNPCAPSALVMDADSVAISVAYRRIVSVSFLRFRPSACSSTIEWEVRQWSVAFSPRKFNVLISGTSAGSIAILVRDDFWGVKYGVNAGLSKFNLRSLIPSLPLIKKSEWSGLKNGPTSSFCMSWRDIRLSWERE